MIIVDGQLLVGAKQNRVVNTTIVVLARTSVEIPVTCVEQGACKLVDETIPHLAVFPKLN